MRAESAAVFQSVPRSGDISVKVWTILIAMCVAIACQAAEPNVDNVVGAKPSWHDLPATDGERHSLDDLADRDVVVIAIMCNHCPLALEYFNRLKAFAEKHSDEDSKVALVAISLSNQETDKLPRMKELADRNEFNFDYLYDGSQDIGRALGATNTPQFFVLDKRRQIAYRGAWDDNMNPSKVKRHYVEDAVEALLAGKSPETSETKTIGCIIHYDK